MGMMSIGKEMLSRKDIEARAREIGEQISKDYEDKELLLDYEIGRASCRERV